MGTRILRCRPMTMTIRRSVSQFAVSAHRTITRGSAPPPWGACSLLGAGGLGVLLAADVRHLHLGFQLLAAAGLAGTQVGVAIGAPRPNGADRRSEEHTF